MAKLNDLIGNYDNLHEAPALLNHPANILAIIITFLVLSWICAVFRLYTRFIIVRSPGWDDFFVILSLLPTTAGSIAICLAVEHGGMGRHFVQLGAKTMENYLKIFYVANASYPLAAGFIKLALLFQYLRVYERDSKFRTATIYTIIVVAVWSAVYTVLGWVPSLPVQGFWNYTVPATRYGFGSLDVGPFVAVYTSLTGSNMALDMIILGLAAPLLLYRRGSHPTRSRWALVGLFAVGSLASVFSVLRLASLIATTACTYPTFDPTWYGSTPIVFAALEVDIATITASLPVFWPVLRDLDMKQILVTREVKVTLEHRRLSTDGTANDPDDDGIELQRSKSGLQVRNTRGEYYDDPYVAQQVNPFTSAEFGVKADVDTGHMGRRKNARGHVSELSR